MSTSYALRELRPVQISRRGSALRFVAITAGASAVFSAGLLLPHPSAAEYRAPMVQEDQRGWDCRTMGNKVCGPSVDLDACAPVGSTGAAADGCPVWGEK